MLTLASVLREMFGVQLYKNNARALLLRILSILNLDWLQHASSVHGVYECLVFYMHSAKWKDVNPQSWDTTVLPRGHHSNGIFG